MYVAFPVTMYVAFPVTMYVAFRVLATQFFYSFLPSPSTNGRATFDPRTDCLAIQTHLLLSRYRSTLSSHSCLPLRLG